MQRRLYRSTEGRSIGGVAMGLASYFDVDVALVRLAFVLLALLNGLGVIVYVILWVIVPEERNSHLTGEEAFRANVEDLTTQTRHIAENFPNRAGVLGLILVGLGVLFLLQRYAAINPAMLLPIILIGLGIFLLVRGRRS